jgi:hypothetical protein
MLGVAFTDGRCAEVIEGAGKVESEQEIVINS